ncbi:MAG: ribosome biogenesis GTPase Der [bacterium]
MIPNVVIVGRPNVGKSSFFNRLVGERKAITSNIPGTTRDRLYSTVEWNSRTFRLVDTAGMFFDPLKEISMDIVDQVYLAIQDADVLIFLTDALDGILPADDQVALALKKTKKPVLLVVNKTDTLRAEQSIYDFYKLGFGDPLPTSALSGRRSGDILDEIVNNLPPAEPEKTEDEELIKIAIVGRPNVGKSTLLNNILGKKQVSVSPKAGTTRDAIDVPYEYNGKKFLLIDTAGIRRKGKVDSGIEHYSVLRALRAIERSDIVLLVLDASEGIAHQDKIILSEIMEEQKNILILANKWDVVLEHAKEKGAVTDTTLRDFERVMGIELKFATWLPILTLSAKTGKRVENIWEEIDKVQTESVKQISQSELQKRLLYWKQQAPIPSKKGQTLRLVGVKQTGTVPLQFTFRVNNPDLVHFSYHRFLENRIRNDFALHKTPIELLFKRISFSSK